VAARVLIVDDDAVFGDLAAELLGILGYAVVGYAEDAAQALAAVERLRPDAVMLDVNLPDSDGFRLAVLLRNGDRPPRVLLVSSDPTQVRPDVLRSCGAVGFVAKTELATTNLAPYLDG
jgi:CheY-like chemotaxis protein